METHLLTHHAALEMDLGSLRHLTTLKRTVSTMIQIVFRQLRCTGGSSIACKQVISYLKK